MIRSVLFAVAATFAAFPVAAQSYHRRHHADRRRRAGPHALRTDRRPEPVRRRRHDRHRPGRPFRPRRLHPARQLLGPHREPRDLPDLTYDRAWDLRGITLLAQQPNILIAAPSKGWKTAGDFVKAAKEAPGKLSYATAGTGNGTHMNAEKFRLSADIGIVQVPYRGTPEALNDTMHGLTDICFCPIVAALPMIRAGRVVALASGSPRRSMQLPDLSTTEEQGFADSGYSFWVGPFAPAETPTALVELLI